MNGKGCNGMERIEMQIPSNPTFERVVRASAHEIGRVLEFSHERIEDLKLAVSEAVNNAIEHGNHGVTGKLVAVVFAVDNDRLDVHIADQGEGVDIEHLDFSPQHVEEHHLDDDGRRGFGMFLISALVDDYEVSSSQSGTVLTLRLYRKGKTDNE
jgi:serine/threonine-protein kinase RsbW